MLKLCNENDQNGVIDIHGIQKIDLCFTVCR